jgi:hypothetical protein
MKISYISVVIVFIMLLLSCGNSRDNFLESSLNFAGSNRAELEKVLNHYQSDTLKLRAAKFLIENMWAHGSFADNYVEKYYDELDSLSAVYAGKYDNATRAAFADFFEKKQFYAPASVSDVKVVNADYLIANIDSAFALLNNCCWLDDLSFSDFCEYILPYKVFENQMLDDWRTYLQDAKFGDMQNFPYTKCSLIRTCQKVNEALYAGFPSHIEIEIETPQVTRAGTLVTSMKARDCTDDANATAVVMRAKGVPVAIDFTPQWATGQLGHVWNALINKAGNNIAFNGITENVFGFAIPRSTSKVYRYTFSVNKELFELNKSGEPIPSLFQSLCFKDVTDDYTAVSDLEIPVKTKNKYAYLCTFNDVGWNPIAFGKVKNGKARFEKVGRNVLYLAAAMSEYGIEPVSDVFILENDGKIEKIQPETGKVQNLRLVRKHPAMLLWWYEMYGKNPVGGRFQAANKPDFSDSITLAVITKLGTESDEFTIKTKEKYRYWRFLSAPNGWADISEVYYIKDKKNISSEGKVMGTRGDAPEQQPERLYDNDPLTYYKASIPTGGWSGIDFGEPVSIDKIIYAPHSDGNCVTFGDEYELSFWDKTQWQSLGKKTAESVYLDFDNCPANALFLLHDITRGVEDRPFLYRDGRQIFY